VKTEEQTGQGQSLSFQDIDTDALAYARSLSVGTPRMEEGAEGAGEGTVPPTEGEEVQSGDPAPVTQQDNTGQGFIDPYLKDLPEDQRGQVAPVLEKFRQDQDANFNRRFEQLQEESRIPSMIHQALIDDPVTTLNWVADRMLEEKGIDVRKELLTKWGETQSQEPQGQGQQVQSEEGKALTAEDVERILTEREQQAQQKSQQADSQQQQIQQQQKTVNGWIDTASKNLSLPLDDSQGEDPLRAVIIMQANQLHESGVAKGQAAVEMAVEAISKRFGGKSNGSSEAQPKVAEGGSPPPAENINFGDRDQRRARMAELFTGASNQ